MNDLSSGPWHMEGLPQWCYLLIYFFLQKEKKKGRKQEENGVCGEMEHGEQGFLVVRREFIPKGHIS